MNAVSQSAAPGSERAPAPSLEAPPLDLAAARLFRAFLGVALLALALGGLAAAGIAAVRTPALGLAVAPLTYYRLLTLHGLATFYHWLLFFQVALLFLAVGLYIPGARPFSLRMGWVAFGTMLLGASLQTVGALAGGEVLYTAFAPLAGQFPRSPLIYSGFLLLSIGLLLVSIDYILTVTRARHAGLVAELPTPTFVGLVWSIVTSAAAVIAIGIYTPALMWVAGIVSLDPMAYMMGYFTYFHVNHYVPLIAAVGVWYALAKHTTGATSILGEHFSKAVFTVYAIIVPPTFLYHLFLAPGVPDNVKTVGSVLSMFIGVPTIIVAIVIVGMLEARMRAAGAIGRLGWLRHLPWGEPAFGGLAMSMATFGVGGAFAYALLAEGLAPLLHGTFLIPAYFHAFTGAGVTLAFMAATFALLPGLTGHALAPIRLARWQPYLMATGATLFVAFGVLAGYTGVPRRVPNIAYGGKISDTWALLMNGAEGIGGLLMVVAGVAFFVVLVATWWGKPAPAPAAVPTVDKPGQMTWAATLPALLVVALIVAVSIASFVLMRQGAFLAH